MRIGRNTQDKINAIKADACAARTQLAQLLARLEEHSGTKRISKPLRQAIEKLDALVRN